MSASERASAGPHRRRIIVVGFRRWKAWNLRNILSGQCLALTFARDAHAAQKLRPCVGDSLAFWGAAPPEGIADLASRTGATLLHIEDGFIRSVGLGSDLIEPQSLVLDARGIYFDATRPSDLEAILAETRFDPELLQRARTVRSRIVDWGLTKYNIEPRHAPRWVTHGRPVVLVPGQVETDASIALGGIDVRTNIALLRAARAARPDACIVYKPHPDVMTRNRRGHLARREAEAFADVIETEASIISCIAACDEVHTITSLSGFDALLRGKRVVTYGAPFYAGWGLTEDRGGAHAAWARRVRTITLDEIVAGALLIYPIYWNVKQTCQTTCESALSSIAQERDLLESTGQLKRMRTGLLRRQMRKLRTLFRAWLGTTWRDRGWS